MYKKRWSLSGHLKNFVIYENFPINYLELIKIDIADLHRTISVDFNEEKDDADFLKTRRPDEKTFRENDAVQFSKLIKTFHMNSIKFGGCPIENRAYEHLVASSIRSLDLEKTKTDDYGVKLISTAHGATTLERLYLQHNIIESTGAQSIAKEIVRSGVLTHLYLGHNMIGDLGAIAIAQAMNDHLCVLTHLGLENNNIGFRGARDIGKALSKLQHLHLSENPLGPEGAQGLADGLNSKTSLTFLDLGSTGIRSEGIKNIADAVQNTPLQTLILRNNSIDDDGFRAIARIVNTSDSLVNLDIYNMMSNAVLDSTATVIAEAVRDSNSLEYVLIQDPLNVKKWKQSSTPLFGILNRLSELECHVIAKCLSVNENLSVLKFHDLLKFPTGLKGIFDAVRDSKTLRKIVLTGFSVSVDEITSIGHVLSKSKSLQELVLIDIGMNDEGAEIFAEALDVNESLEDLDLSFNQIGDVSVEDVRCQKTNKSSRYDKEPNLHPQSLSVHKPLTESSSLSSLFISQNEFLKGLQHDLKLLAGAVASSSLKKISVSSGDSLNRLLKFGNAIYIPRVGPRLRHRITSLQSVSKLMKMRHTSTFRLLW